MPVSRFSMVSDVSADVYLLLGSTPPPLPLKASFEMRESFLKFVTSVLSIVAEIDGSDLLKMRARPHITGSGQCDRHTAREQPTQQKHVDCVNASRTQPRSPARPPARSPARPLAVYARSCVNIRRQRGEWPSAARSSFAATSTHEHEPKKKRHQQRRLAQRTRGARQTTHTSH